MSTWIITVRDGLDTKACSAEIAKTGAQINNVLPTIGAIVASTSNADSSKIKKLPCVLGVEAEGTVSATLGKGEFFPQVETNWNLVVKDNEDVQACAAKVEKTGAKVTQVLSFVGIISATTPTGDARALETLACVKSVEQDSIVSISNPSAAAASKWIVSVRDDSDAQKCAELVKGSSVQIDAVFNSIGIFVATTPTADASALQNATCVSAVEAEGILTGGAISGVSN
jgi:L-fucose isomerase-like protein